MNTADVEPNVFGGTARGPRRVPVSDQLGSRQYGQVDDVHAKATLHRNLSSNRSRCRSPRTETASTTPCCKHGKNRRVVKEQIYLPAVEAGVHHFVFGGCASQRATVSGLLRMQRVKDSLIPIAAAYPPSQL